MEGFKIGHCRHPAIKPPICASLTGVMGRGAQVVADQLQGVQVVSIALLAVVDAAGQAEYARAAAANLVERQYLFRHDVHVHSKAHWRLVKEAWDFCVRPVLLRVYSVRVRQVWQDERGFVLLTRLLSGRAYLPWTEVQLARCHLWFCRQMIAVGKAYAETG